MHLPTSAHTASNEISGFPVDPRCPFPEYTKSASTVRDQLMAVGHLIQTTALHPGRSVLKFGPGWGNTTIALGPRGLRSHSVGHRPKLRPTDSGQSRPPALTPDARVGAFLDAATIDGQHDAVLFYEFFPPLLRSCATTRQLAPGRKPPAAWWRSRRNRSSMASTLLGLTSQRRVASHDPPERMARTGFHRVVFHRDVSAPRFARLPANR